MHPRSGRLWANVRPVGAQTPVPNYPLDALYDQAAVEAAVAAERERCAKVCKNLALEADGDIGFRDGCHECADGIRGLPDLT